VIVRHPTDPSTAAVHSMLSDQDHVRYVHNFVRSRREAGYTLSQVFDQFSMATDQQSQYSWESATVEQISQAIITWIQKNQQVSDSSSDEKLVNAEPKPIEQQSTAWEPSMMKVTQNLALDGARVSFCDAAGEVLSEKWDTSSVVVLDDLFGEPERAAIMKTLLGPSGSDSDPEPPSERWSKRGLYDGHGVAAAAGWGLKSHYMDQLLGNSGVLEIQSRLAKIYPEYTICHIPYVDIGAGGQSAVAEPMVANAPVVGESFEWHVDADPRMLPDSPFVTRWGRYPNRQPGKPLFVSLLVYLNSHWQSNWEAPTMFLDLETDTCMAVLPKLGRAVLMDQDVTHKVCAPAASAGRPRYSVVWKLLLMPRENAPLSIAHQQWGAPTMFGSANQATGAEAECDATGADVEAGGHGPAKRAKVE